MSFLPARVCAFLSMCRHFRFKAGGGTGVSSQELHSAERRSTCGCYDSPRPQSHPRGEGGRGRGFTGSPVIQPQVRALVVSYAKHCDTAAAHGRSGSSFSHPQESQYTPHVLYINPPKHPTHTPLHVRTTYERIVFILFNRNDSTAM